MQVTTPDSRTIERTIELDWSTIDTIFLDMDGTLLDLNFDNHVWNEVVPKAFAQAQGTPFEAAQSTLLKQMSLVRGTIEFYSFEYWTAYTGLDLMALHRVMSHLVSYRPGALEFLRWSRSQGKQVVIATNAHPHSLIVKEETVPIAREVDAVISSHAFNAPKEDLHFWHALHAQHPFDPTRTLFVDDNEPVLDSAGEYGIRHLLSITTPDSERPGRADLNYPAFDHFAEIYDRD